MWPRRVCGCYWLWLHDEDCLWELPVLTEENPNEAPYNQDDE